jgi:hypothetical protein
MPLVIGVICVGLFTVALTGAAAEQRPDPILRELLPKLRGDLSAAMAAEVREYAQAHATATSRRSTP